MLTVIRPLSNRHIHAIRPLSYSSVQYYNNSRPVTAAVTVDARTVKTGFNPDTYRSNFNLFNVIRSGDFSLVPKLFDQMPHKNSVSTNMLISSYAKSGNLSKAKQLFDNMHDRNAVTWTILIGAYSQYNQPKQAFTLYAQMHSSAEVNPDHVTFATLLSGSITGKEAIQAHSQVFKFGLDTNLMVCNSLINSYCKCSCLHLALGIFNQMPIRDSVTFNTLITGYTKDGLIQNAVNLFMEMQKMGLKPTDFTFAAVLCSGTDDVTLGQQVHGSVIKINYEANVFVGNALLDFYSKHDRMGDAKQLFDEMPVLDGVSYNVVISGYAREGQYKSSLDLFLELQLKRFGSRRQLPFATMLNVAASTMQLEMGRQIHSQAIVTTDISKTHVGNSLVDMYAKCGRFEEANTVFVNLSSRDTVSWTAVISAYVQNGLYEEGLQLFNNMHGARVIPDQATFASVIKASSSLASLSLGKQLHSLITRTGYLDNVFCGSTLVDMYAKCGSIREAIQTFQEMPDRNIVSWNALISAYAQNGDGEATLWSFQQMVQSGLQPDSVSFLNVLKACSHRGLVEKGLQSFHSMVNVYNFVPRREHYASMIDLLCRSGQFIKVGKLMDEMPFEPDEIMWSSVLNSCRIHKNQELAKKAAEHLFSMVKLRDAAAYVTMSNIYASLGQWENVGKVKKAMRERGVKKIPAYSWVEVKHKVHLFSSNDKVHPQMEEIMRKIDTLSECIEREGHKPDLSCALHNVDDEFKKVSLKYHCERLAIAFALISTPEGSPILIMKNLRACTDCHAAIKLISKVVGREITVRDSSRFHHFKEGLCSCRDYW